ncbi:MAG: FAD binding domain-containing protein [Deltaproteobacteria bacterium]|uniref:FAD binding domain-containing protein n=1 Tax=Desulfobacula sp. TaxID=2593537 RepID=UPI001995FAD5|nr:FAD binding domain-containing protein [Candidatus Desulfobacula maris]MBL6993883.1 FAD binding domain-containing protein [Desulfobacula sp.]
MIKEVFKPASIEEAVKLKSESIFYLSGGTQINWAQAQADRKLNGKPAIEKVILVQDLLSKEIKKQGSDLFIGAGITLQELIDSSQTPGVLKKAAGYIASRNIRNMATLGGNIAANRPDSYILPCLIALNAEVIIADKEKISVESYDSRKNYLITQIILPRVDGVCVIDVALKSSGAYPSVTCAVRVSDKDVVVALGCVSDHVIRLKEIESGIMDGSLSGDTLAAAVANKIHPKSDLSGSAAYKKYISGSMIAHLVALSQKGAERKL